MDPVVPAAALLPLRFFLGGMFLYAGLDKLLDPTFLRPDGPGSIGAQLQEFARVSPLAPFVTTFAEPFPVLVGLGVALLEVAIGLGALLGLLYRASAAAGAALAFLFFLTASWTTRPFYLGPDLPYAFGWITLAVAGSGGLLTVDGWLARREAERAGPPPRRGEVRQGASSATATDPDRRAFLELGALAAATIAVATLTRGFSRPAAATTASGPSDGGLGGTPSSGGPSPGAGAATPSPTPAAASPDAGGTLLGNVSQLPVGRAGRFHVATNGDPAVIVHLKDGSLVAFDAVCTHEGCTVGYDAGSGLLLCPCHGAAFDPTDHAAVVGGPTDTPLTELPLRVDQATGSIYLVG